MHHVDTNKKHREKARWELFKNATCCLVHPGSSTPQNSSCSAIYLPSHKPFKYFLSTAGEARTNSCDILLSTLAHCWLTSKSSHQHCVDTRYNLEDLPVAMDDKDGWWERVSKLHAANAIRWWWWWWEKHILLVLYRNKVRHWQLNTDCRWMEVVGL